MKTIIQISVCVVLLGFFTSCRTCKIEPPPSVKGTNKEASAKAAASALGSAISGGEAGGSFKSTVNNTYQTVGQDDVAFYLLLQAYNCESARGHTAAAAEILSLARQELARRHDATPQPTLLAVTSTSLTPTETKVLKNSAPALKEEVKATIATPKPPPPAKKAVKKKAPKAKASPSPAA